MERHGVSRVSGVGGGKMMLCLHAVVWGASVRHGTSNM